MEPTNLTPRVAGTTSSNRRAPQRATGRAWPLTSLPTARRSSFNDVRVHLFRVVKVLQVEVEGLLRVEHLVVDRRLELPADFDADVCNSTVARLCRLANLHLPIATAHVSHNG